MNSRPETIEQNFFPVKNEVSKALTLLIDKIRSKTLVYEEALEYLFIVPKPEEGEVLIYTSQDDYQKHALTPQEFCEALHFLRKEGLLSQDPIPRDYETHLEYAKERGHSTSIWIPGDFLIAINATGKFEEKAAGLLRTIEEGRTQEKTIYLSFNADDGLLTNQAGSALPFKDRENRYNQSLVLNFLMNNLSEDDFEHGIERSYESLMDDIPVIKTKKAAKSMLERIQKRIHNHFGIDDFVIVTEKSIGLNNKYIQK